MILYSYERKGILLLIVFITLLNTVPRFFLNSASDQEVFPFTVLPLDGMVKDSVHVLELNTADSLALVEIKGIGAYTASRILTYRKRLGGYRSVSQLKELKMTYFNVDSLAYLFSADPSLIRKRDLNRMTFREVLSHPYLEYEDVKAIFRTKDRCKSISFDTLQQRGVLPNYTLRRIKPYFK